MDAAMTRDARMHTIHMVAPFKSSRRLRKKLGHAIGVGQSRLIGEDPGPLVIDHRVEGGHLLQEARIGSAPNHLRARFGVAVDEDDPSLFHRTRGKARKVSLGRKAKDGGKVIGGNLVAAGTLPSPSDLDRRSMKPTVGMPKTGMH